MPARRNIAAAVAVAVGPPPGRMRLTAVPVSCAPATANHARVCSATRSTSHRHTQLVTSQASVRTAKGQSRWASDRHDANTVSRLGSSRYSDTPPSTTRTAGRTFAGHHPPEPRFGGSEAADPSRCAVTPFVVPQPLETVDEEPPPCCHRVMAHTGGEGSASLSESPLPRPRPATSGILPRQRDPGASCGYWPDGADEGHLLLLRIPRTEHIRLVPDPPRRSPVRPGAGRVRAAERSRADRPRSRGEAS